MPAEMRRGIFENAIFIRRILLNYGHGAKSVSRVDAPQRGIVSGAIDSGADGQDSDNCAGLRVQYDQFSVSSRAEEAMMFGVEREARGSFAGIQFVAFHNGLFLWIDHHEFALVFLILVDHAWRGSRPGVPRALL